MHLHPPARRIVCLGDSITDGYTYAQLIMQALAEARQPVPACICSGVCGETAEHMDARFEQTVAVFAPGLVTVSAGANDAIKNATPDQYEQAVRSILAKIHKLGAAAIVLTPCEYLARNENQSEIVARLDRCEATLRRAAADCGAAIAETRALMRAAVTRGETIMTADGIHPNYRGQQLMARSLLDALGHDGVPLPALFEPRLFPGVVKKWKVRPAPAPLAADNCDLLVHDDSCITYELPEHEPNAASAEEWMEQLRRNGFATQLDQRIGKGPAQAWTELHLDQPRNAFAQISVNIATVWVNGRKVHEQGAAYNGNHAGKDRVPVALQAGRNIIAIDITGPFWFFALTPGLIWEEQLAAHYA